MTHRTPVRPTPSRTGRSRVWALARLTASSAVLFAVVIGVPYGLAASAGVPWPEPAVSFEDLLARFGQPLSDPLVVKLLALIGWVCWTAFLATLAREAAWTVRQLPVLRRDGSLLRTRLRALPAHRVAAALLIGTLLLSWAAAWSPAPAHAAAPDSAVSARSVAYTSAPVSVPAAAPVGPARSAEVVHTVPYTVVPGDTLWDIAREYLDDPLKWPKIYQMSRDRIQVDGQRLRDPDLILPGWVLHLPTDSGAPGGPAQGPDHTAPPPKVSSPEESPSEVQAPAYEAPVPTQQHDAGQRANSRDAPPPHRRSSEVRPVSIGVGPASAIGITTAAGIAAALAFARAHSRRRRQADLDAPEPPPLAEAVRAANSAHLAVHQASSALPQDAEAITSRRPTPAESGSPGAVMCAHRDGQELSADALAVVGGIALTGPGADLAARALAIAVLSAAQRLRPDPPKARLILPALTAERLLPGLAPDLPGWTSTVDSDHALDLVEQALLHRARLSDDHSPGAPLPPGPPMDLLICGSDASRHERLKATARRAGPGQLAVVMLGADTWENTARLAADGTVIGTTGPGVGLLDAATLFTVAPEPARDLLDVIHGAHGRTPRSTSPPTSPVTPAPLPEPEVAKSAAATATSATNEREDNTPIGEECDRADDAPDDAEAEAPRKPVTVQLLGGFRIHARRKGEEFGFGLKGETREFIAVLAAHPRGIRGEEIVEHLRLSTDPEQSSRDLGNLRRAVRRSLRQATGAQQAAFLVRSGDRIRLDPNLVATDVEAFTAAVQQAASARSGGARAAALRKAVDAYRGRLCEGADYPWADELREALHRKAVDALVLLADHTAAAHPDPDPALALLDQAAEWDPVNEAVYERIIRLQLSAGRDDAARRTYQLLARRLSDIDATPDPATTALLGRQRHPAATR